MVAAICVNRCLHDKNKQSICTLDRLDATRVNGRLRQIFALASAYRVIPFKWISRHPESAWSRGYGEWARRAALIDRFNCRNVSEKWATDGRAGERARSTLVELFRRQYKALNVLSRTRARATVCAHPATRISPSKTSLMKIIIVDVK